MRSSFLLLGVLTLSGCFLGSDDQTRSGREELVVEPGARPTSAVTLEGSSGRPMKVTFENLTPACARAWLCFGGERPLDECVEKLETFETDMVARAAFVIERLERSTVDGSACGVARGVVHWVHPKAERRRSSSDDDWDD